MAVLAPDGDPFEAVEFAVLRRPLAEIGQSEADASVVREESGVAFGHGRLGGLEVRVDESARIRSLPRPSVLEFEGGAGQRRGELLEVGRDEVLGQGEVLLEFDDELLHIECGLGAVTPAGDAVFVDDPVLERQQPCGEGVASAAVDGQLPGAVPGVRRGGAALPRGRRGGAPASAETSPASSLTRRGVMSRSWANSDRALATRWRWTTANASALR